MSTEFSYQIPKDIFGMAPNVSLGHGSVFAQLLSVLGLLFEPMAVDYLSISCTSLFKMKF